ncbi:MAG: hypothetical protein COV59_00495 [Candidatus Magasanikbacteria bacterium CG11_big_fil_rev_8_21_14_0_20_39_34]|uniref:Uncharacterized protein n=1 Tax=Candidatus Magasanikbacteria bacterium CG11_big_fil_rev_8_21_14_0_20_39_34 TaxID=1974653 RepID=A0A2H0N6Q6_9BACT|nr:MAG: hypothetical protein COV59_00495 [Candidatus Magasanikbacteria bacterium CG11_big_fil_rev_8_21_14_0_20_39_34]
MQDAIQFHTGIVLSCTLPMLVDIHYMGRYLRFIFGKTEWSIFLYFYYFGARSPFEIKKWAVSLGEEAPSTRAAHQEFMQAAKEFGSLWRCRWLILIGQYPEAVHLIARDVRRKEQSIHDNLLRTYADFFGIRRRIEDLIRSGRRDTADQLLARRRQEEETAAQREAQRQERDISRLRARADRQGILHEVDELLRTAGLAAAQSFMHDWGQYADLLQEAERHGCTPVVQALLLERNEQAARHIVRLHAQVEATLQEAVLLGLKFKREELLEDPSNLEAARHTIAEEREKNAWTEQLEGIERRVELIRYEDRITARVHEALDAVRSSKPGRGRRIALRGLELAISRANDRKKRRHR